MYKRQEQKFENVRFTRVDSDIIDNLIVKEDKKNEALEAGKQEVLSSIFKSQLPKMEMCIRDRYLFVIDFPFQTSG